MANGHSDSVIAFEDMGAKVGILAQQIRTIEGSVAAIQTAIASLSSKLEDRARPQWGLLVSLASFILLFVSSVGFLAYAPISRGLADMQLALSETVKAQASILETLRANYPTKEDLQWRADRARDDRLRTDQSIRDLQDSVFPREVHIQRWARFDADIAAARHDSDIQIANLQRQIEQLQKAQSDTYTARDAIIENKEQIRQLEGQLRSILERKYP